MINSNRTLTKPCHTKLPNEKQRALLKQLRITGYVRLMLSKKSLPSVISLGMLTNLSYSSPPPSLRILIKDVGVALKFF